jgi:hypothetical protein
VPQTSHAYKILGWTTALNNFIFRYGLDCMCREWNIPYTAANEAAPLRAAVFSSFVDNRHTASTKHQPKIFVFILHRNYLPLHSKLLPLPYLRQCCVEHHHFGLRYAHCEVVSSSQKSARPVQQAL